jgi:hypothetical protein
MATGKPIGKSVWRCLLAGGLAALGACGSDTGIIVVVDTDMPVPEQVEGFRITVKGSRPQPLVEMFDLRPAAARPSRPVRVGLRPGNPDKPPTVMVEATALRGLAGGLVEVVNNRAELTFRRGEVYTVSLPLNAACNPVRCPIDHTCNSRGLCVPVGSGGPPGGGDAGAGDGVVPAIDGQPAPDGGLSGDLAPVGDAAPGVDGPGGGPPRTDGSTGGADLPVTPPPGKDAAGPVDAPAPPVDAPAPPVDTRPPPVDAPPMPPPDVPPAKRPNGATCAAAVDCQSNACVDGVCCDAPCGGQCHSCRAAETGAIDGHCAPVLANRDPDNECAAESPDSCGLDGACNGQGACRQYGADTECAAAACISSSSFSPARRCGGGACQPAEPQGCGRYVCAPQGCPTSCQGHAECASNSYCEGSTCVDRKGLGSSCRSDRECDEGLGLGCLLGLCTL